MNAGGDGIARWRRVADAIRGQIGDGALAEKLPAEHELAAQFGVNRQTVRRAISVLTEEGLLRPERGRGTFINAAPRRVVYPIGARTRFSENMLKQAIEPSGRLVHSERVVADTALASALQCRAGAPLHKLQTLSVAEGIPISRSTSYFSAERFPNIVEAYAETGSITAALQREGVIDYRRRETRITAERVSQQDTELLRCAPDAIVLVTSAIDIDTENHPIQTIRTKFLSDLMELTIEMPIQGTKGPDGYDGGK